MNLIDSAYERLAKTSPELMKFVVSFVDMTKDVPENAGIELGVFVLMSGSEMYYVPVVSKGGTVFPMDSIFVQSESMFFPLTSKIVEKIVNTNEANLGQATRIPPQVVKNPNVRELIEPPKTGKYMYASTGLHDFVAQLSEANKRDFLEKLATDSSFAFGLKGVGIDVKDLALTLAEQHTKIASHDFEISLKVVTDGVNLPDEIVQQIMQRGYAYTGYNANPAFAVEYDAKNDGYTKLGAAEAGKVYEVITKEGGAKVGFVPPRLHSFNEKSIHTNDHSGKAIAEVVLGTNKPHGQHPFIIFENGDYSASCHSPVIRATTMGDLVGLTTNLAELGLIVDAERFVKPIDSYSAKYVLMTPTAWVGPFSVAMVTKTDVGTVIRGNSWDNDSVSIHVSPNLHGDLVINGHDVYVSPKAAILCLGKDVSDSLETDVVIASNRRNLMYTNYMAPVKIDYDGLEFSINGRRVGGEADLAKELVERKGLDKVAFEVFQTKARQNGRCEVWMSKAAASNTSAMNDPTAFMPGMPTGNNPVTPDNVLPNRGQTGQVSYDNMNTAVGTGDKSIVESTIISEFLNDPNMFETIQTYLPDIRESIDKMGRSILLIRLNIGNLSATIQPEYVSSLLSSLRNTYKMLGDSYLRLENLSTTPLVEESQV